MTKNNRTSESGSQHFVAHLLHRVF